MKARTKLQHRVVDLSSRLLKISESEKKWAFKECLEHKGFATKKQVACMDCGESFSVDLVKRKTAICPHCHTKLQVIETKKRTLYQKEYFATAEIFGEFQVIRHYELVSWHKKGIPRVSKISEVLQYWIGPDGKVTKIGHQQYSTWGSCAWGGDWSIRVDPKSYYSAHKYDIYPCKYHPNSVFKQQYSKYGIDYRLQGLNILEAIQLVPHDSRLETLLKSGRYNLLSVDQWKIREYWESIKISLRNKYKIKDASIWFDYLELLNYFKKDLRNAKYVCPRNLKKQHDILVAKKRKIQEAEARERQRQEAIKRQKNLEIAIKEYVERCQQFFNLEFNKGDISIKVLQSVEEFKEEGDELKHCVFANEYYLKENSLILSAKVNGKRTETVELKLDTLKIEQSRGKHNQATEYHDQIIQLVRKNTPKIRKILKQSSQQMSA